MTTYYEEFIVHNGSRQPLALYRREIESGVNVDRIYTRDGTWAPTGEIAAWSLGMGDLDMEEVDAVAAGSFIEKVKDSFLA